MAGKNHELLASRQEFVALASVQGACMTTLCRRFGISRKSGYKWLARFRADGPAALADRSRRPLRFRAPSSHEIEAKVLAALDRHPAWGGRKIRHWLLGKGVEHVPAASTVTAILRRHGRLEAPSVQGRRDWIRFEHPAPNDLWQMDFKGEFSLSEGGECFALTVLDDHSRYSLAVRACGGQQGATVKAHLTDVFRRYGLPRRMLMDNGSPWGVSHTPGAFTKLTVWFMRLGVHVWHGQPYHPQTQGKEERFHRTLKLEVISRGPMDNLTHAQRRFDPFRHDYNHERPHESLGMAVPASRYHVSTRSFPEVLPPVQYAEDLSVRKVNPVGQFSFQGRTWKISEAFARQPIGLRATTEDGVWDIHYSGHLIGRLDLKSPAKSDLLVDVRPRPSLAEAATLASKELQARPQ